jgi:murein DD-endopeptidase MepM/ murein hydrolase activator NlpD
MLMRLPGGSQHYCSTPAGGNVPVHRSRAYIAACLAAALLLSAAVPALGVTREEFEAAQRRASQARQAAKAAQALAGELAKETADLDAKIDSLQVKVSELAPLIDKATARSERLRTEVASLRVAVELKTEEIDATRAEFDTEQGLLNERMAQTYKQGDLYLLEMLLEAEDFGDFIARTELVQRVIRSNQSLAEGLLRTKADLEEAQVTLERSLETVQIKLTEAAAVEKELRGLRSQRQSHVAEQKSVYRQKSELLAETSANAKRLKAIAEDEERESARIAAELARASQGGGYFNGVMAWPVPGFYRITSPYGYRIHPILHTRKLHTGIDIGKNGDSDPISGAAIVSAGAGTVIFAGYRSGYGNTVMVDHGDGVVTLYAHQPAGGIRVGNGENVEKGDRIGTVGSTGYSTGPHLHFEVRVNGEPKDPMPYLR